jgi:hypothetical protein
MAAKKSNIEYEFRLYKKEVGNEDEFVDGGSTVNTQKEAIAEAKDALSRFDTNHFAVIMKTFLRVDKVNDVKVTAIK